MIASGRDWLENAANFPFFAYTFMFETLENLLRMLSFYVGIEFWGLLALRAGFQKAPIIPRQRFVAASRGWGI